MAASRLYEVQEVVVAQPAPPLHELGAEIAEMGNRSAEGRRAEPQEHKEDRQPSQRCVVPFVARVPFDQPDALPP